MGLEVPLEHGRRVPDTNVSGDDEFSTCKTAWAHLNVFPDHYTHPAQMETYAEWYLGRSWPRLRRGLPGTSPWAAADAARPS